MTSEVRDERVRKVSLLSRLLSRPELGRRRRHGPRLRVLRRRRRRQRPVQRQGHHQLPRGLGPARHPRRAGGAADDRRRIRSLDRLDDRLRRHPDRDPGGLLGLAGVAFPHLRICRVRRHRRAQRPGGRAHGAAVLHRHARQPVHAARPDARRHARYLRPDPGLGRSPAGRRRSAERALLRHGSERIRRVAVGSGADRQARRRAAGHYRAFRSRSSGGSGSRCSAPGS